MKWGWSTPVPVYMTNIPGVSETCCKSALNTPKKVSTILAKRPCCYRPHSQDDRWRWQHWSGSDQWRTGAGATASPPHHCTSFSELLTFCFVLENRLSCCVLLCSLSLRRMGYKRLRARQKYNNTRNKEYGQTNFKFPFNNNCCLPVGRQWRPHSF